ncbi:MAG: hypothetical protein PSV35_05680, partial [bacterium]|nr:hypothetical protein [bacterium]
MTTLDIVTYNESNILAWKNEALILQRQLATNENEIRAHNERLTPLQTQVNLLQSQILMTESQLSQEQLNQDRFNTKCTHHHPNDSHHHHNPGVIETVGTIFSTVNIIGLQINLNNLRDQLSVIQNTIQPLVNRIIHLENEITRFKPRHSSLQELIAQAQCFLKQLESDPQGLLQTLQNNMLTFFKKYTYENPANRSTQV